MGDFGYKESHSSPEYIVAGGTLFFTFQAMSYTIEVYRGHQKPETFWYLCTVCNVLPATGCRPD